MDTLKQWWEKAKYNLTTHWVWIAAIAAATLIAVSPLIGDDESRSAARTIGSVILASGIAGAVIRSSTFTDMFIGRIVDVFYDGKHLQSRKDMKDICTRTLNALLESESPFLRGAVGNELLNGYLDFKLGYIYKDFKAQIQIEKIDRDNGTLHILETTRTTIIPNKGTTSVELNWTWNSTTPGSKSSAELVYISIDEKAIPLDEVNQDGTTTTSNGFKYIHRLEKSQTEENAPFIEYVRRVRKVVDLRRDPVSVCRFTAPCLGMSVDLFDFPEQDIKCETTALGLPESFKPDRMPNEKSGHWRSQRYSRLIFPRQGVMLQWMILDKE